MMNQRKVDYWSNQCMAAHWNQDITQSILSLPQRFNVALLWNCRNYKRQMVKVRAAEAKLQAFLCHIHVILLVPDVPICQYHSQLKTMLLFFYWKLCYIWLSTIKHNALFKLQSSVVPWPSWVAQWLVETCKSFSSLHSFPHEEL